MSFNFLTKILFFASLAAITVIGCSRNDYYDQSNFGATPSGLSAESAASGSPEQISIIKQTEDCLACHDQDYRTFAKNQLDHLQKKHDALGDNYKFANYWTNPHLSTHGSNIQCLTCHEINKDLAVVNKDYISPDNTTETTCSNKVVPNAIKVCMTCHFGTCFIAGVNGSHTNQFEGFYDPEHLK